jgi:hypothetical protein
MPESTMKPSIWIYGGVHDDPGSRQRFLAELTKQDTAPHFVAVEWEKSVFERFAAWRPWIEEGLKSRWSFLPQKDRHELSLGLAWEGDAFAICFPSTDLLWLESGFQEADLKQLYGMNADKYPENCAISLLRRLCGPCYPTMAEVLPTSPPTKVEV